VMGSPEDESGRRNNEGPRHEVQITRGFHLGVYLVTQDEYQQVVGSNPSHFKGERRRPVENVNWFDAVSFCNGLSEREQLPLFYDIQKQTVRIIGGNGYRLPTEAEWEYACRAGTTSRWWFGGEETRLSQFAWYEHNSGGTTHPVGARPANPWDLHDIHGNVWEWCQDLYGAGFYRQSPAADPIGPDSGNGRVLRGGSWADQAGLCRSSIRGDVPPDFRDSIIGFRAART